MTAEYLLRASVKSLTQGKRGPHCFRAWVMGQGYVNDGRAPYDYADYVRQAIRAAQSEVANMQWAKEYGEPGYTNPKNHILFANWNNLPSRTTDLLERMGYACEWSDEWTTCDNCGMAMRTSPDGWHLEPGYTVMTNGEIFCNRCRDEE